MAGLQSGECGEGGGESGRPPGPLWGVWTSLRGLGSRPKGMECPQAGEWQILVHILGHALHF